MAVALDALGTVFQLDNQTSGSGTPVTVGGSATLLVATVIWQAVALVTGRSVTWNGVAMNEAVVSNNSVDANLTAGVYTLVSPASGAQTLALSWTNTADCYACATSFTGTDTTTGYNAANNASDTGTNISLTVTSTSDGATLCVFGCNGGDPVITGTPTPNEIWSIAPLDPGGGAAYTLGGTSNSTTFTEGSSTRRVLAGINIIAGASGGAVAEFVMMPGDLSGIGSPGQFFQDRLQ